jgi:CYTH domain-containing protein
MNKEIERKFLVKNLNFKNLGICYEIEQGYICAEKERVVRVRRINNNAFLTIKSASIGFSRYEFEYEIPLKDARNMLKTLCFQPTIKKKRYVLFFEGKKWEIDVFEGENSGLIIAEIELKSEDEIFQIPDFIGEEVTSDVRYYNAYISKNSRISDFTFFKS